MKIVINNNTGMDFNNMPYDVIRLMNRGTDGNREGEAIFFETDSPEEAERIIINEINSRIGPGACRSDIVNEDEGACIHLNVFSQGRRPVTEEQVDVRLRRNQEFGSPAITPARQARTQEEVRGPITNEQMLDELQEGPEQADGLLLTDEERVIEDAAEDIPTQAPAEQEGGLMPPGERVVEVINEEELSTVIASHMEGQISADAKELSDLVMKMNKQKAELVPMERKVREMTTAIDGNHIVARLIEDAGELMEEDNLVEDVKFTRTNILVDTRRLHTEHAIAGSVRSVGKMRIAIPLNALLSGASDGSSVKIANRTQIYQPPGRSTRWQCGHAKENEVCWGTAYEDVFNAIVNRDIKSIVDIVIMFITNPDETDPWGQYIKYFPPVQED